MQIAKKHLWQSAWRWLARPNFPGFPLLTAAEQTQRSWARQVESLGETPEIYRDFFAAFPPAPFPYAVLTPTYEGFLQRENQKLVCCPDEHIFILEKIRNDLACLCYAAADISYVEMGVILLQAWITLRGASSGGRLVSATLKFNAVTERLFWPILAKIRGEPDRAGDPAGGRAERRKFDYLGDLNFKFMNFGKSSILPGDTVRCIVLQPEIRAGLLRLFGRSISRTVAVAHLTILTGRELIIIRDASAEKGMRYGGVWTYIPLSKIASVSLAPAGDNLLALSIHLPGGDRIESLFGPETRPEVDELVEQIVNSRAKKPEANPQGFQAPPGTLLPEI